MEKSIKIRGEKKVKSGREVIKGGMKGKQKIIGTMIAVMLVASVALMVIPPGIARDKNGNIQSGDTLFCGESELSFNTTDLPNVARLEGRFGDAEGEVISIADPTNFYIPDDAKEGVYDIIDVNGNDIGDLTIKKPSIGGDIFLAGTTDSIVGKSIPVGQPITIRVDVNFGGLLRQSINSASPGEWGTIDIKLYDPDGIQLISVRDTAGNTIQLTDIPADASQIDIDNIATIGWELGEYTLKISSNPETCNEVDIESVEYKFTLHKEELSIDVEDNVVSRSEDIIVNVCGNPETYYYLIITDVIEEEPPSIEFAGDVVDLPNAGEPGAENVSVDIDNDGVYDHFLASWIRTGADGTATVRIDTTDADDRTYTIRVYHNPVQSLGNDGIYGTADDDILLNPGQGGPEWATERDIADSEDYDKVYVRVEKRKVTFDIPSKVAIGETVTIKGTISAGTDVDILIDDGDVKYIDEVPVDENKEFEVDWDTDGLTKGSYTIDVYIDCDCSDYACIRNADLDPDGSTTIRLIVPGLDAKQLRNVVAEGDDYVIEGMATGVDYVDLVLIGPEGYPSDDPGLDVINGLQIVSISVTENEFSEEITMEEGLDTGMWIAMIFAPGRDGIYAAIYDIYGNPIGAGDLNRMNRSDLLGKDQEQIEGILMNKTINVAGSDDFLVTFTFKVESPYVKLNSVEPVMVGEPLNITGTTNREPGTIIMISTITGPVGLPAVLTKVAWPTPDEGVFSATIDTSDAVPGTYILEADDGDGHTDTVTVEIKEAAPTIDTGQSLNPYPSIFGTHNCTIVPANDITVSKIFVYPCVGTGGHAEYVRIWGNGVDAHATWNGYGGEWNILHFNRTFTLEAGKEYNFTIKTGSYPQIFHEEVLETLDGSIVRCEEFVDANGKRHKWIPAFKIYA
ncbi:MAG: DUF3821 domain-containing protein [Candidatus Methanospirare jalkutatii]|nr:MAG: DUF3821 domain-containing protein [Candidatus Methanospirare jalkutatii]